MPAGSYAIERSKGAFRRGPTRPGSATHGASPLTHRPENTFSRPLWLTGIGFPYPIPRFFQYLLAGPAGLRCRRQRNLASHRAQTINLPETHLQLTCAPPSCNVQDACQICALRTDSLAWPCHYYSLASHYLPPKPCSRGSFLAAPAVAMRAPAPPTPGMRLVLLQETAAPAAAADASVDSSAIPDAAASAAVAG